MLIFIYKRFLSKNKEKLIIFADSEIDFSCLSDYSKTNMFIMNIIIRYFSQPIIIISRNLLAYYCTTNTSFSSLRI